MCGELRRFGEDNKGILNSVSLGTASGGNRISETLEMRHPLRSPYNFFTWADQISAFADEVIQPKGKGKVTLVANSIGTISALQAAIDRPDLYNGLLTVAPNFRELHSAEVSKFFFYYILLLLLQSAF